MLFDSVYGGLSVRILRLHAARYFDTRQPACHNMLFTRGSVCSLSLYFSLRRKRVFILLCPSHTDSIKNKTKNVFQKSFSPQIHRVIGCSQCTHCVRVDGTLTERRNPPVALTLRVELW